MTDTNFSSHDPSHSNLDYNLGQNKMEEQANRPPKAPPPKFEDEAMQYFPILHWGVGGGGDKFPISSDQDILSVIVARLWIFHCIVLGFSLCG